MPLLTIFSTLLGWGGLRLMCPWDNAQWDLELTYPITELLAFFTALCVLTTHESSESSSLVAMYLDKIFVPSSLEFHVLGRECGIWLWINWVLRIMKDSSKGALLSLSGTIWESSFFISSSSSKPLACFLTPCNSSVSWNRENRTCSDSDDGCLVHSLSAFRYLCDCPRVTEI